MLFKLKTKESIYYYDNYLNKFYDCDFNGLNFYHYINNNSFLVPELPSRYLEDVCTEKPINYSFKDKRPIVENIKWLDLIVGNKCNYRCKYCIQAEHKEHIKYSSNAFKEKLLASGIDVKNQIKMVRMWGGEALVYKDRVKDVVIFLRDSLDYKGHILLITNGSLFDEDFCSFCLDYKVRVTFSHDGPAHKYYRNLNDYLDVPKIRNAVIRQLKAGQNTKGISTTGAMFAVINKRNYLFEKTIEWFNRKLYDGCPVGMDTLYKADLSNKYLLDQYTETDFLNIEKELERAMFCPEDDPYYVYYFGFRRFKWSTVTKLFLQVPYTSLNARCPSQSKTEKICFDLMGRNLTCYADQAHFNNAYGSLDDLENCGWNLRSLQDRQMCLHCPYVINCMGMCPMLDDDNHLIRCKSQLPVIKAAFKAAFYELTNEKIISIEPYEKTHSLY